MPAPRTAQPPPAPYEAEVTTAPSIREALVAWFFTVVLFSAVALAGPVFAPLVHTGRLDPNVAFGKGEILGLGLAVFAAALSRWVVRGPQSSVPLRSLSTLGLILVAIAIALVWLDSYQVDTGQSKALFFPQSRVFTASWILLVASLLCGVATEVKYARSLQRPAVKLI